MKTWMVAVLACGVLLSLSPSLPAQVPAKPDKKMSAKLTEGWISKQIAQEFAAACAAGQYEEFGKRVDAMILERLSLGHVDQLEALTDLVYVRRACKYLPMADKFGAKRKFSAWLVKNRDVSRLLFRAIGDVPKTELAVEKLHFLWEKDEKRVAAYADLAVAFATTDPRHPNYPQLKPSNFAQSFDWYTNPKIPFRTDLKVVPYEISRYLTNTSLSLEERQWAVNHYANKKVLAKSYFDVKYDYDHYLKNMPKKISKLDFTLPNLAAVGGVCIEQAYFASEICKALGEPAVIVGGTTSGGEGHAWMASLKLKRVGQGWQAMWDSQTGRYAEYSFFVGDLRDPASGKNIQDCELVLIGAAAQLPLERKEQADAACELAQFVADRAKAETKVTELAELKKLAEANDKRVEASDKNAAKADMEGWAPAKPIDAALVEALVNRTIEANLAHRPVWDLVISLRKAGEISSAGTGKFLDTLITRTGKEFPDYSATMVMQIVPTLQEPSAREKVYKKAIGFYSARPDLQGRLSVALADDLYDQDKKDEALRIYSQVAAGNMKYTQIVMDASAHAADRLIKDDKTNMAIQMYASLFAMAKKPRADAGGYAASVFCQLGSRLAALLDKDGQEDAAKKVREKIGAKEKK